MEQSPSLQDVSRLTGQEIPHLLLETDNSLPCSEESITGPFRSQLNPVHTFTSILMFS
jgi:hypothetical protein